MKNATHKRLTAQSPPETPRQKLDALLDGSPEYMRKILQLDFEGLWSLSGSAKAEWKLSGYPLSVDEETRRQYEALLQRCDPEEWKRYKKRCVLNVFQVSKGKRGARPKSELAAEAASLRQQGMNDVQIADRLGRQYGKRTPESINKLLQRHSPR